MRQVHEVKAQGMPNPSGQASPFACSRFITADVVIRACADLSPLARCLPQDAGLTQFHRGADGEQVLVLQAVRGHRDADALLAHWCRWLAQLPSAARACWDGADSRTIDLGFESGHGGPAMELQLPPGRLADLAALGTSLQLTIYPLQRD